MAVAVVVPAITGTMAGIRRLILVAVADTGVVAGTVTVPVVNAVAGTGRFPVVTGLADIARPARRIAALAIGRVPVAGVRDAGHGTRQQQDCQHHQPLRLAA